VGPSPDTAPELKALDGLDEHARERLGTLVRLLGEGARVPSSVTEPERAWRVHVADSLAGLEVAPLRTATWIGDLGAGAGFPGLPLAVALPKARFDLIEATSGKCAFIERAIAEMGIPNAAVVCERAESWADEGAGGREAYEAIAARAVGPLTTLCELASPLLTEGGSLIAWRGRRSEEAEAAAQRAGERTAMEPVEVISIQPYPASRDRHLHVYRKAGPTPADLPRRPGMARKRPFG
jgi:16S rRNA (guanine527-N7)-methyltransferase